MLRAHGRLLFDLLRPAQLAADARIAATFRSWSLAASADSPSSGDQTDVGAVSQSEEAGATGTETAQDQQASPDNAAAASTPAEKAQEDDDDWPYEHSREGEAQIAALLDEEIAELKALEQTTPAELRQTVLDMQGEIIRLQYEEQQAGIEPEPLDFTPNPEEPLTINFAGAGRPGWRVANYDEKMMATYWACDLIGGAVPDNELNAQLCDETKELMHDWNKNWGWTESDLAIYFRVRRQRVMAIIALKEMEKAEEARTGRPLDVELQYAVEGGPGRRDDNLDGEHGIWECDQIAGTGERHVKMLPRSPTYEWGNNTGPDERKRAEAALRHDMEVEVLEQKLALEEDEQMVQEFRERLDFNLGRTGKEVKRESRKHAAPKRPPGGYSLVVKTLDNKGEDGHAKAYVAPPGGGRRGLTPSEQVYRNRQKPRPRRRIL